MFGLWAGVAAAYLFVYGLWRVVLLIGGIESMARYHLHGRIARTEGLLEGNVSSLPPISILVPAHNEAPVIVEAVRSVLRSRYPIFEVVVVNDGSDDATLGVMADAFSLTRTDRACPMQVPHLAARAIYASRTDLQLTVVDKERGGKADALNTALDLARYHLVAIVDGDTVLQNDSLLHCARPFSDPETVASSGIVRVANGCHVVNGRVRRVRLPHRAIPLLQFLEYTRTFLASRSAVSFVNGLSVISGAFGVFRRDVLVEVGGFARDTVAEDMEVVLRIHHHFLAAAIPYRVAFVPDAVAWTEAPETLPGLGRQRTRWQQGLSDVLWRYRGMLLRPRFGVMGMVVLPSQWLFEMLEPEFEVASVVALAVLALLGHAAWQMPLLMFAALSAMGWLFSVLALLGGELIFGPSRRAGEVLRAVLWSLTEPLWYHWLQVVWRTRGTILGCLPSRQVAWQMPARTAAWGRAGDPAQR